MATWPLQYQFWPARTRASCALVATTLLAVVEATQTLTLMTTDLIINAVMRKIFSTVMLVAAAAMTFVSCQKEENRAPETVSARWG